MKKAIVITSIFKPTEAVVCFSKLEDYKLYVVGDSKTPLNWNCENVIYLSVNYQTNSEFSLSNILPYNHYCRKMLGYLEAIKNGAEYIVDTDDDNIPKSNWSFPEFDNIFECVSKNMSFINIYQLFTNTKIWPRGLPLGLINTNFDLKNNINPKNCKVGVWQGLADEDPDVDAIYRLTSDNPCVFFERNPIVLGNGTVCPFNTQNTLIRKELFVLLYLPTYVTFRFTDILRGLVAQPIMWLYNYQLGFINATVIQKRNPHDYMKDFISEIPMYLQCEKVVDIVMDNISENDNIETNLYNAYIALFNEGIVCDKELITLEAWINDYKSLLSIC